MGCRPHMCVIDAETIVEVGVVPRGRYHRHTTAAIRPPAAKVVVVVLVHVVIDEQQQRVGILQPPLDRRIEDIV